MTLPFPSAGSSGASCVAALLTSGWAACPDLLRTIGGGRAAHRARGPQSSPRGGREMNERMNGRSQFCPVVSVGLRAGSASHRSLRLLTHNMGRRPSTAENYSEKPMRR